MSGGRSYMLLHGDIVDEKVNTNDLRVVWTGDGEEAAVRQLDARTEAHLKENPRYMSLGDRGHRIVGPHYYLLVTYEVPEGVK